MIQNSTSNKFIYVTEGDDEMVYDCPRESIMVFDVDCQGLFELTPIGKKVMVEYPKVFKAYKLGCLHGSFVAGQTLLMKDGDKHLALVFTTNYKVGIVKDVDETVLRNTKAALERLISMSDPNALFASSIINRHTKTWPYLSAWLLEKKVHWLVYKR